MLEPRLQKRRACNRLVVSKGPLMLEVLLILEGLRMLWGRLVTRSILLKGLLVDASPSLAQAQRLGR